MAHAQKPDFVFRRNGRVHLNQLGTSVQSTTGSRGVCIGGNNAGYTMFRGSVKSTGYPLHLPVSPSLPLPCINMCHHISNGVSSKRATTCIQYSARDYCQYWIQNKSFSYVTLLFNLKISFYTKTITYNEILFVNINIAA